jgi:ABC-type antimicrobial peptide transport system permease subunit
VLAYSVSQRTQEIGVRMALGADARSVVRLVVGSALGWVGAGAAAGLVAAVLLTRVLQSFLFGVEPTDPVTLAGVLVVLAAVAVLAGYVPARRATRVDPIVAMRVE